MHLVYTQMKETYDEAIAIRYVSELEAVGCDRLPRSGGHWGYPGKCLAMTASRVPGGSGTNSVTMPSDSLRLAVIPRFPGQGV